MTTCAQARARDRAEPVYLVEIELKNSGATLYLAERNITAGGMRYEDYLLEIDGVEDELLRASSDTFNAEVTLRLRNDRYGAYEYLILLGETYPFEGAVCTIKETYLDGASMPSAPETVFRGVLDEPRQIDLMGMVLTVSDMSFAADLRFA